MITLLIYLIDLEGNTFEQLYEFELGDVAGSLQVIHQRLLQTFQTHRYAKFELVVKAGSLTFEIDDVSLSDRELEVVDLIASGHSNRMISEKLFISFETVRSHRKNIMRKMHVKNTAALIRAYLQTQIHPKG
jgi:DNA-binding NarL/FixJ family response regulator